MCSRTSSKAGPMAFASDKSTETGAHFDSVPLAQARRSSREPRPIACHQRDVETLPCESFGDGQTDARACTGDHADSSFHHSLPGYRLWSMRISYLLLSDEIFSVERTCAAVIDFA